MPGWRSDDRRRQPRAAVVAWIRRRGTDEWICLVGPDQAVELFGIRLVGLSVESGRKLLLTLALAVLILLLGRVLRAVARWMLRDRHERIRFWTRQAIQLVTMVLLPSTPRPTLAPFRC